MRIREVPVDPLFSQLLAACWPAEQLNTSSTPLPKTASFLHFSISSFPISHFLVPGFTSTHVCDGHQKGTVTWVLILRAHFCSPQCWLRTQNYYGISRSRLVRDTYGKSAHCIGITKRALFARQLRNFFLVDVKRVKPREWIVLQRTSTNARIEARYDCMALYL